MGGGSVGGQLWEDVQTYTSERPDIVGCTLQSCWDTSELYISKTIFYSL